MPQKYFVDGPVLESATLLANRVQESRRDYDKVVFYVDIDGESVLENLVNRRSRPVEFYRQVLATELAKLGLYAETLRWNQYAGCKCPCSPGFVVWMTYDQRTKLPGYAPGPFNMWLKLKFK